MPTELFMLTLSAPLLLKGWREKPKWAFVLCANLMGRVIYILNCFSIYEENEPVVFLELHACLHCIYIGCIESTAPLNHRDLHSKQKYAFFRDIKMVKLILHKKCSPLFCCRSHPFSVDLNYGNVYCAECSDYVYNPDLETISEASFDK